MRLAAQIALAVALPASFVFAQTTQKSPAPTTQQSTTTDKAAIKQLIKNLSSPSEPIATKAADALGEQAESSPEITDGLLTALEGKRDWLKVHAAQAIGKLQDRAALASLKGIADDKHQPDAVRKAASDAVAAYGDLSDEEKLWMQHAKEFIVVGDEFIRLPPMNFSFTFGMDGQGMNLPSAALVGAPAKGATAKVGTWGRFVSPSKVLQILGPDDMLISVAELLPTGDYSRRSYRVKGISTSGVVDDQIWNFPEPMALIGTTKYETVIGSGRTVLLAMPIRIVRKGVSFEDFEKIVAKKIDLDDPTPRTENAR